MHEGFDSCDRVLITEPGILAVLLLIALLIGVLASLAEPVGYISPKNIENSAFDLFP
ncbi:hypothetical protein IQ276_021635 [Desmonostoc muscorum LEGE 12446]|uniref:Uncharacterized protein n=1 Tax=Desmonostoc muscorum LEGE 12446 TaxID=1828758 RepID=A0A8J7D874_DESMC|nr:hypothetical protein [Desmonostoc muscorum]MCF2148981.1 hypothetical protein [Desmonostoc muscorum LEGE 12446]